VSNSIKKVHAPNQVNRSLVAPIQEAANSRGHGRQTAGSGAGGLIGGMVGSFAGPGGAFLGAALGAAIGYAICS
jgi:hypothetical protein